MTDGPLQPVTRILWLPLWLLAMVFSITGCDVSDSSTKPISPVHLSGPTMGTWYSVKIVSPEAVDEKRLSQKVESLLANINGLMSTYDANSELSRFNQMPINTPMTLSSDTVAVMKMALELSEVTAGAFDITIGPVVNLWGFGPRGRFEQKPDDVVLSEALSNVGYQSLVWEGENRLFKTKPVYVDLSAIAKGYAVDKVAELLRSEGYSRFLVDIGGELVAGKSKAPGLDWKVAVEQPVAHKRAVQKAFSLRDMGVATSGDYRNFYELDGRRYSHTIDPRTGLPVTHSLASVSVLHASVAYADALATALMVLGVEEGFKLADSLGVSAYFIYKNENGFDVKATDVFLNYIQR